VRSSSAAARRLFEEQRTLWAKIRACRKRAVALEAELAAHQNMYGRWVDSLGRRVVPVNHAPTPKSASPAPIFQPVNSRFCTIM
jgi:hypothetical protein